LSCSTEVHETRARAGALGAGTEGEEKGHAHMAVCMSGGGSGGARDEAVLQSQAQLQMTLPGLVAANFLWVHTSREVNSPRVWHPRLPDNMQAGHGEPVEKCKGECVHKQREARKGKPWRGERSPSNTASTSPERAHTERIVSTGSFACGV